MQSPDGKVVIPVDMATEFMTKIAGLEGYQPADAAKLADQQVKGLAAMGQMFRITTMEDNAISSSLQYANGRGDAERTENAAARFCRDVWSGSAFAAGQRAAGRPAAAG